MLNKKVMWVVDKFGKKRLIATGLIVVCLVVLLIISLNTKDNSAKPSKDPSQNSKNRTSNQISLDDEVNQIDREIDDSTDPEQKLQYMYYLYDRYIQMQDYDKALDELKSIESVEKTKFYIYEMYGDVYAYKKEKDQAIKHYDLAIQEASNDKEMDITIYAKRIEAKKTNLSTEQIPVESGDAPE